MKTRRTKPWMPRLTAALVARVRSEMLERGYALLPSAALNDERPCRRMDPGRTMLKAGGKLWWKYPQLDRYAAWLEALLGQALAEEAVSFTALEVRHEPAGFEDQEVDRLHADGSYIRSVYTPYGLPTLYREGNAEQEVPRGQTLLMTASDRCRVMGVPCTLHRRPGPGPARVVIVCSFASAGLIHSREA